MEAGYAKNLRFGSRSQELLTFFQSHCSLPRGFASGCFLIPKEIKKNDIEAFLRVCFVCSYVYFFVVFKKFLFCIINGKTSFFIDFSSDSGCIV